MWKYLTVILLWNSFPGLTMLGQNATGEQSCLDCHKELMANQIVHPPADEACDYCHESTGNEHPGDSGRGFRLADDLPGLCYMCHEEYAEKYIHAPAEAGECVICHSPHSSTNPILLLANPVAVLCFECHDQEIAENKINHQPVSEGNCQNCHNPHQSKNRSLLNLALPDLCFNCHEDPGQQMTAKHIHPPFEDDCRNCHLVHGSTEKNLLDQTTSDLCFNCHDDVKESIDSMPVVHGAVKIKKACVNCHSPHASAEDKFLLNENIELCLSCHNKSITKGTKKLANIRKKINSNFVHLAIEFDGCSGCHSSHASVLPSMLKDSFPPGPYAPANPNSFALCFSCHDTGMIETEVTRTATNFRNGDQNLHYVHIQGEKGRNCKDCHDMHGSAYEHLISGSITFGNWEMPLKYQAIENGGSCLTGCHSEKKYYRD